ncbi:hypothetical protein FRC04_010935 [Tulasnella sp. 424]|nr:hypothetical protein FRC04_010935 [Tulasnella sp. 424]KAG8975703.1 hypothetical protein FRC05_005221 [Tulasnella sp. 425]
MSDSESKFYDSDSDYAENTRKKASARRRVAGSGRAASTIANATILGKIPEIAKVDVVATDSGGVADVAEEDDKLSKVNSDTLKRIQSALALAQHPNTGVAEAHNAMRVASRLMAKENITQADLIARETEAEKSKRAGLSTVNIIPNPDYKLGRKRKDDDEIKLVQNKSWHEMCAWAMDEFFNVKSYSTSFNYEAKLTWTFYGIAENTTAAAFAFEMVHNTIMTWSYENRSLKGRVAYNSYREGVARGLVEIALKEKEDEERKAIANEKKLIAERVKREEEDRQREVERLEGPPPRVKEEPVDDTPLASGARVKLEEVDDADAVPRAQPARAKSESPVPTLLGDALDDDAHMSGDEVEGIVAADFQDDDPIDEDWRPQGDPNEPFRWVPFNVEPKAEPVEPKLEPKAEPEDIPAGEGWQSSAQLVRFRNDAETIADNFLKGKGIKVSTGRARTRNKRDASAYAQGKEDSKKIDVKRRRLENQHADD